jgi:hypothetical protein
MTRISRIFISLIVFGFSLVSCDQNPDIGVSELTTIPSDAATLDTLITTAITTATLDGTAVKIDSYDWIITDPDGNEVSTIFEQRNTIRWAPTKEGEYLIEVKVSSNKSSAKRTFPVSFRNSVRSLQKALTGEWEGTAIAPYFPYGPRTVNFTIDKKGHYSAFIVSDPEPRSGVNFSVLGNGVDSWDHPTKKFLIGALQDNGTATGTIKFVHFSGQVLEYNVVTIIFSADYNTLTFNTGHFDPEFFIEYQLTRRK